VGVDAGSLLKPIGVRRFNRLGHLPPDRQSFFEGQRPGFESFGQSRPLVHHNDPVF